MSKVNNKFKVGMKFKCLFCGTEFEPTKEEWHLIKNYPQEHDLDGEKTDQPIPFCSVECFRLKRPSSSIPCHDELWYHNGPVNRNIDYSKINVSGIEGLTVRNMTEQEAQITKKYRGRDGFSYGSSVCILPSAIFYGKSKSPINWKSDN